MGYEPRLFNGEKWKTNFGEILDPLTEMEVGHLTNTLKFIQKPHVLEGFKMIALAEYYSLPAPNGEMAEIGYFEELNHMENCLEQISPKEYFECYIMPSNLFQRMLKSYTNKTGKTEIPKPWLNQMDTLWYETGKHPADSSEEHNQSKFY